MSYLSKLQKCTAILGFTLLISVSVSNFSHSAVAALLTPGQLIKGSGSAVYYYARNGSRFVFPQEKIFNTWYTDFSGVIQTADTALGTIPLGGNVTYHPGTRLVKITSASKVYAVGQNGLLRWVQTEDLARTLYGPDWNTQIDDISDAYFVNYTLGTPIASPRDFSPEAERAAANIESSVGGSAAIASSLAPMPLISRNLPASASASSYPALNANDANYSSYWRSTGSLPAWLAYDLSNVPTTHRGNIDVVWYENSNYNYDLTVRGDTAYNQPRDYQLQANAAPGGGSAPKDGWVTLAAVTGNTLHSREQRVNLTGYNWLRLYVTAVNGSTQNKDVALNLDVHDASAGASDSWMFYGDSITAGGMQNDATYGPTIPDLINGALPQYRPVQQDGGIGGYRSIDGVTQIPLWLPFFPGHYVGISFGTNDVNGLPCSDANIIANNLKTIAHVIIAAGKVPIIPHIPWARLPAVQQCAPAVNAAIDRFIAADSRILAGPDLYTFFFEHQSLISTDNLHPTQAGFAAMRQQWANTMLSTIYNKTTESPSIPVVTTMSPTVSSNIVLMVDASEPRLPISPFIYGTNERTKNMNGQDRLQNIKLYRQGGNRLTAYNWENNASNAGIDYGPNSSDSYLNASLVPGHVAIQEVAEARSRGAATLLTLPIVDYVAADKKGVVTETASDSSSRWLNNYPNKPSILLTSPNTQDHAVYQDEFVHLITQTFPNNSDIFFALDNEPGIWSTTHPLVHPKVTTYAEMARRTSQFATMIKQQAPHALVFGAVAYGYNEYTNLQNAPDANGRDYIDFFLDTAKAAGASAGQRVVDVLDLHWYPEAQGDGKRITNENSVAPSLTSIEARVQAPRSLWDSTYTENSWIADSIGGPINLISRLKEKIAMHYPGTKLSFSEYNYGGSQHISGGVAQADALGIFGREGVFAASFWPLKDTATSFAYGGFDMFLNYDGAGHSVGDLSLAAQTSDATKTSVYAMARSANPSELTIIEINKTDQPLLVTTDIGNSKPYTSVMAYQLTQASTTPVPRAAPLLQNTRMTTTLPALSVTTFVLKR